MNNTTESLRNVSSDQQQFCILTLQQRYMKIIALAIVTITTYFGNVLILFTLRRYSSNFKGTLYMIISNLAVADLLLAFGLTLQLAEFLFTDLENDKYFCVIKTCCMTVSITCSSDMLSYMSIDRFCAIIFPMRHFLNSHKKKAKRSILASTWFISLLIGVTPILLPAFSKSTDEFSCKYGYMIPYKASVFAAIFLPIEFGFNMCLCLIVMWRVLTNPAARNNYRKSMIKCLLTLQIYILFALCWGPYVVTTVLMEVNKEDRNNYFCFREFAILFGFMNSGLNWILYSLANKKFRKSFKKVISCKTVNTAGRVTGLCNI